MRRFKLVLLASVVLLAAGCEGDKGPTGPAGEDGNANVVTGTISPTSEEWLWNSMYEFQIVPGSWMGYFTRYVDVTVTEITADIIADGLVLVFFEAKPGSGNWTPLPFQYVESSGQYSYNIVNEVMEGAIRLHYFYMANLPTATMPVLRLAEIPTYTFKYVVIEGSALVEMQARGVDVADHDRVADYLTSR